MRPLEIIVCIKPVPDPTKWKDLALDPDTKTLNREAIPNIINPLDKHGLEEALRLKEEFGGKVRVISMAPPSAVRCLHEALAMGAEEAYLLSDRAFAGADTLATARVLKAGIQKIGLFDLIICGQQSLDGGTEQVAPQLAHLLGLPSILSVCRLEAAAEGPWNFISVIEQGYLELEARPPLLVSVTKALNTPRYTTFLGILEAEKKAITSWSVGDLDIDTRSVGLSGSPTKMADYVIPDLKRCGVKLEGDPKELAERIIESLYRTGVL